MLVEFWLCWYSWLLLAFEFLFGALLALSLVEWSNWLSIGSLSDSTCRVTDWLLASIGSPIGELSCLVIFGCGGWCGFVSLFSLWFVLLMALCCSQCGGFGGL